MTEPSVVTVDALGEPGQRTFLVQVRQARSIVTVKLEKLQVAALAQHLGEMLKDLARPGHVPEGDELAFDASDPPSFVVGALAVSYDEVADRIVLLAEELVAEEPALGADEDLGGDEGSTLRVAMSREQAAGFAIRGAMLVGAGRAPCPLCGYPLDQAGHACPKTNGFRAPVT